MCIGYTCRVCSVPNTIYCPSADWNQFNPECHRPTLDPEPHIKQKKCYTCELVEGAIRELRTLVFQMPWLETDGMSGADNRPAWELGESLEAIRDKKVIDWSLTEDMELMKRIEKMGLEGLDGKDALNDGHGVKVAAIGNTAAHTREGEEESGSERRDSTWGSDGSSRTCITIEENPNGQDEKTLE